MSESRYLKVVGELNASYNRALGRAKEPKYRWTINVKPKGNPFTDGDNYWIDADSRDEAILELQRRERLNKHDFIVTDRRNR